MKKGTDTTRRDFIRAASAVMVATTAAAAQPRPDAYASTAERIAVLLESPDTPEPLRGMLLYIVEAYPQNMADELSPAITPEYVRRELPALMAAAVREGFVYTDIGFDATSFTSRPFGEEGER
jgi:hypothetical protein